MTKIEWVKNPDNITQGITVNSKTGCVNGCPYCYAWKLANTRLKERYLENRNVSPIMDGVNDLAYSLRYATPFYPRWWPERLDKIRAIQKPTGIFLDDMSDWMWEGWPAEWTRKEIQVMRDCIQHRFYTLTKQPQNLIKFSPFPDNCWVGVTATNTAMFMQACSKLEYPLEAKLKYVSLEPLLSWDFNWNASYLVNTLDRADIDWLIIGACTGTKKDMEELCNRYPNLTLIHWKGNIWTAQPRIEDLREIVEAADKAGVKVFLKDNLKPLLLSQGTQDNRFWRDLTDSQGFEPLHTELRQEMPNG